MTLNLKAIKALCLGDCRNQLSTAVPKLLTDFAQLNDANCNDQLEILEVLLTKFAVAASVCDMESRIFSQISQKTLQLLNNLLETVVNLAQTRDQAQDLHNGIFQNLQAVCHVMSSLEECIKALTLRGDVIRVRDVHSLLPLTLNIILTSYKHCQASSTLYGELLTTLSRQLSTLFKRAHSLQMALLGLLDHLSQQEKLEPTDVADLGEVLMRLRDIAEVAQKLDVKLTVTLWRSLCKLACQYKQCCAMAGVNMSLIVDTLCRDMTSSFVYLMQQVQSHQPDGAATATFSKCLKVIVFQLKIAARLIEQFASALDARCVDGIYDLCVLILGHSSPCRRSLVLKTSLADDIKAQLVTVVPVIIQQLCGLESFRRRALQPRCDNTNTNDDVTVLPATDTGDDVTVMPQLGSSAARCMMLAAVCEHVHRLDAYDACAWYSGDATTTTAAAAATSGASSASLLHAVFASFSDCYLEILSPESRTAGVQHPAAGVQHPAAGVQHPAAGVQHPAAGVQHPAAGVQHPAACVQHPAAGVQHPAAGVQHPAAAEQTQQLMTLYEQVLVAVCAYVSSVPAQHFHAVEDCLLRNVLQPERPRALLAVDVWCFVARFGSAHLCRQHCVTLSQLYLSSSSSSPSAASSVTSGHLRLLVARLVKFLAPEHQADYIERFNVEQNLRLWSILPLHVFSRQLLEKAFSDVTQMVIGCVESFDDGITTAAGLQLVDQVLACLNNFLQHTSIAEAYVTPANVKSLLCVVLKTISVLSKLCADDLSSTSSRCAQTTIDCAAQLLPRMDNSQVLQLLDFIVQLQSRDDTVTSSAAVKLSCVNLLAACSSVTFSLDSKQQPILRSIATLFRLLLSDANPFVYQRTVAVFGEFAETTTHESVVPECLSGGGEALQEAVVTYLSKVSEKLVNKTELPAEYLSQQFKTVKQFWVEHKICDASLQETFVADNNTDSCTEPENKKRKLHTVNSDSDLESEVGQVLSRMKSDSKTLTSLLRNFPSIPAWISVDISSIVTSLQR